MTTTAAAKRLSSKQRILDLLSDHRTHHMQELNAISYRYGGRLLELRRAGYDIETIRLAADEFAYVLHRAEPKQGVLI